MWYMDLAFYMESLSWFRDAIMFSGSKLAMNCTTIQHMESHKKPEISRNDEATAETVRKAPNQGVKAATEWRDVQVSTPLSG
jgi:hypothetical protein